MKTILSALGLSLLIFTSCGGQKKVEVDFIQDNIDNAVAQNTIQTDIIEKSGKILNPRTINEDGSISGIRRQTSAQNPPAGKAGQKAEIGRAHV